MLLGFERRTISGIWSFGNKDKKTLEGKEIDDSKEIRKNEPEREQIEEETQKYIETDKQ